MGQSKARLHEQRLTDSRIRSLRDPGRYRDGACLYLEVEPGGAKHWIVRLVVNGRRRDIGLGGLSTVSLAQAREKARTARTAARNGQEPISALRGAGHRKSSPSLREVAEQVYEARKPTWKNAKHVWQWRASLDKYVMPTLGDMPVDQIKQPDLLRVLEPIWLRVPETARRVKHRLGVILDWSKAHGHRAGESPLDQIELGLPKQTDRPENMAALSYDKIPSFIQALRASTADSATQLALEFLILTAARPTEVRMAEWSEIDIGALQRTIPAARMKAAVDHVIPLSPRAVEILSEAEKLRHNGSPLVFPSRTGRPLSDATLAKLARSLGYGHLTAHGFRSTFRDWISECTHFPSELAEKALSHKVKSRVEAAYRRGNLLEKRRELMNAWEAYVCGVQQTQSAP